MTCHIVLVQNNNANGIAFYRISDRLTCLILLLPGGVLNCAPTLIAAKNPNDGHLAARGITHQADLADVVAVGRGAPGLPQVVGTVVGARRYTPSGRCVRHGVGALPPGGTRCRCCGTGGVLRNRICRRRPRVRRNAEAQAHRAGGDPALAMNLVMDRRGARCVTMAVEARWSIYRGLEEICCLDSWGMDVSIRPFEDVAWRSCLYLNGDTDVIKVDTDDALEVPIKYSQQ